MAMSPLAPDPNFQESADRFYEVKQAANPTRRGPLRFQEGLNTDSDIPQNFGLGQDQGYRTAPGRTNHNANVFEKPPEETVRARAHVGSASWPEAPTFISEFAGGVNEREQVYFQVGRGPIQGTHYARSNYARVE